MNYQKGIREMQLVREITQGKVCRNSEHSGHVMANTISCLKESIKAPYKINHYKQYENI
jgi:hypothetical protein